MIDVMIDIETLGTKPGAAILSIGAVMFSATGLGETFYTPVSLKSCTDIGLTVDPDTVAWWMQQSEEARQAAFQADAPPLQTALLRLNDWFATQRARRPLVSWSHVRCAPAGRSLYGLQAANSVEVLRCARYTHAV